MSNDLSKEKCEILLSIKNKIYDKRIKIQKKLRKKKYRKSGLRVFRIYLTSKEYLYLKYFYTKMVKYNKVEQNNLKFFIRTFLKFDCGNIFYREYFIGVKMFDKYKKMSDKSFFSQDKRVVLDNVVIGIITK